MPVGVKPRLRALLVQVVHQGLRAVVVLGRRVVHQVLQGNLARVAHQGGRVRLVLRAVVVLRLIRSPVLIRRLYRLPAKIRDLKPATMARRIELKLPLALVNCLVLSSNVILR